MQILAVAEAPYNPLEKKHLAESVVGALMAKTCSPLPPSESFEGAGVYALYYAGDFKPYSRVAKANGRGRCEVPIYVGRAQHAGARKGLIDEEPTGQPLYGRLSQHAASIKATKNLELEDFRCRYLVVDDLWVPLAERVLLRLYKPLWNVTVEGFGIHDPGRRRKDQWKSHWDILHEGRAWANKLARGKMRLADVVALVEKHFREV